MKYVTLRVEELKNLLGPEEFEDLVIGEPEFISLKLSKTISVEDLINDLENAAFRGGDLQTWSEIADILLRAEVRTEPVCDVDFSECDEIAEMLVEGARDE